LISGIGGEIMTDEHNTENKQRLLDYKMDRAVWSDANLGKESKEISFEHLGGKCILPAPEKFAARSAKPVDFSVIPGWRQISPAPTVEETERERE
jgi:hypothetical protein